MSQEQQILNHFQKKGSITPLQALNKYGVFRLAARVNSLRNKGYGIETETLKRGEKRLARYRYHSKRGQK